jgi:cobalt-zinc-cadmium efflux system outer membrane protein
MAQTLTRCRWLQRLGGCCLAAFGWLGMSTAYAGSALPQSLPEGSADALPAQLSINDAVVWALQHNPELATLRQQHGIAAAGIVIANTYPFNPVWEGKVFGDNGPISAGITNRVPNEHKFLIDIECRGQPKHRRAGAQAALSRTDWEIANQEVALSVRVIRAYNAVLYRQEKMSLIEQTIRINKEASKHVKAYVKEGAMRPADEIVIEAEVKDAQAQRGQGQAFLVAAWQDLYRSLGLVGEEFQAQGALEAPLGTWDNDLITETALGHRADLHAQQAAVAEAEAKLRLTVANRYGNINIGPMYVYDPTRINFIGAQITMPLPVLNTHRGEIAQSEAEVSKAFLQLRQLEVQIRQDVRAALAKLEQAKTWLKTYERKVVPSLEKSLKQMNHLLEAGDKTVNVISLIDINRKLLKARESALDARWELKQAQVDLAAAVGEPALAISPEAPIERSEGCIANESPSHKGDRTAKIQESCPKQGSDPLDLEGQTPVSDCPKQGSDPLGLEGLTPVSGGTRFGMDYKP